MVNGKVEPAIELEQVWLAFDRWRRQRGGKGRIPERLWDLATSAARTNGIGLVSREADVPFPGDGFIDLGLVSPPTEHQPSTGCLVEIQKERRMEPSCVCVLAMGHSWTGNGSKTPFCRRKEG
jgi:hypothetical protein